MSDTVRVLPADDREHIRTGMSVDSLKRAYRDNLFYVQGRDWEVATLNDYYMAAAYTVRDRLLDRWLSTAKTYKKTQSRTVCYLSAEYLLGPHLGNNLLNLGIAEQAAQAAEELGLDSEEILEELKREASSGVFFGMKEKVEDFYEDLYEYVYGSAAVIGLQMLPILAYTVITDGPDAVEWMIPLFVLTTILTTMAGPMANNIGPNLVGGDLN